MIKYTNLPDNKNRIYGGAYSVHDNDLMTERDQLIRQFTTIDHDVTDTAEKIKSDFLELYRDWMFREFDFQNVNLYKHACFTQGTTESFAQFYIRYRDRYRLRIKKGEYFYHQMMKSLWYTNNFAWLDDDILRPNDVMLISIPFADTDGRHDNLDELLDQCDALDIPVMLDLAYLNMAVGSVLGQTIDFGRPCIKYVVSSLSKIFPVENLRIGIRLQKEFYEDQIYVINEKNYNYINLLSAYVGHGMMQRFATDYMFNKYRAKQLEMCQQLGLDASPCFVFGIDQHDRYPEYNRGGITNRLCFSRVWDGRNQKLGLAV